MREHSASLNKRNISFENIGRRKQHDPNLIQLYEFHYDIGQHTSNNRTYTEELLTHYHVTTRAYLKAKGFKETNGYFEVIDGKIVKCERVWKTLWAAIEERDGNNQSGEYLASLIEHNCRMLSGKWPPTHADCRETYDILMQIQNHYFQLYLLEQVHPQYSAGKKRMPESRSKRSDFEAKAIRIFKKLKIDNPKLKKEDCYRHTEIKLKEKYGDNIPKASTIKSWLKSNVSIKHWWKDEEAQIKKVG